MKLADAPPFRTNESLLMIPMLFPPRQQRKAAILSLLGAALLGGVTACDTREVPAAAPPAAAADDPALTALGDSVLQALVAGDTAALRRLRLTEQVHSETVWPQLPASDPALNFSAEMAWQNIEMRNYRAIARLLPRYRGRQLAYRGTECRGPEEKYQGFTIRSDCWVQYRDSAGSEHEMQLFKHVLTRSEGLRLFRYYED